MTTTSSSEDKYLINYGSHNYSRGRGRSSQNRVNR